MNQVMMLVGLFGAFFFLTKFYYTLSVIQYMDITEWQTVKARLQAWHIERAFKIFIGAIVTYSTGMVLAGFGLRVTTLPLSIFEIAAGAVMSTGFILFLRTIYTTLKA